MDIFTIKQIAEEQNVSYEAIRKQVARYADELKDHIVRKNRTQYIDEWGRNFLREKRKENPIILMNMDQSEQIGELKAQVELLSRKLLSAQERIIDLQAMEKEVLETKVRHELLVEDYKRLTADMERKQSELDQKQADLDRTHEDLTQAQANLLQTQTQLRLAEIDRDAARAEANSFQKSWFGFYRKT